MSKETSMSPTTMKSDTKPERSGVLPGVVFLALDVAERSQSTALAAINDARVEIRSAVDSGIELAEKLAAGAFRFTKKVVQKVDDVSADTLGGVERLLSNTIRSARETTKAAQELA